MEYQRAVQFGEPLTRESTSRGSLSDEEKASTWYTGSELRAMRNEAFCLIKDVKSRQDMTNHISFASVVKRIYDACLHDSVPSSPDMKLFVEWARACPSRGGLEKFCTADVCEKVKVRRRNAIRVLLEIQKRSLDMTPDQRADQLHRAALKLSRGAMVYARVLGIADAASVKEHVEKRPHQEVSDCETEESGPIKKQRTVSPQSTVVFHPELTVVAE